MSKTLYYRETDPSTGKQRWVKLPGVTSAGNMMFIRGWKLSKRWSSPGTFVYKKTKSQEVIE